MSTNSRTWFYNEPEHRPFYIEERVNQTLWASRFGDIYLDCVRAESPFKMEGTWNEMDITLEWVANQWLKLTANKEDITLIKGFAQVLQFDPTVSYVDESGVFHVEWYRTEGEKQIQRIKGLPNYSSVRTYAK